MKDFSLSNKSFSSKLLLFGEYTILSGSAALAIPFDAFQGGFKAANETDPKLIPIFDYVRNLNFEAHKPLSLDFDKLDHWIQKGIIFDSNIKMGYGIGSSGALTAAILHEFFLGHSSFTNSEKQKLLAQIESFFHGKSSGTDALAIFLNKSIHIDTEKQIKLLDFSKSDLPGYFFLLDSFKERSTKALVEHFREKIVSAENENALSNLKAAVGYSIDASIEGDFGKLYDNYQKISKIQYQLFKHMIPENQLEIWKNGIDSNEYQIKLLGAGGGGYLLGLTDHPDKIEGISGVKLINH